MSETIKSLVNLRVDIPDPNSISWIQLNLGFGFGRIARTQLPNGVLVENPGFNNVEKHLAKDLPGFIDVLVRADAEVTKHNAEVEAFRMSIADKLRESLSKIAPFRGDWSNVPNIINFDQILYSLMNEWFTFLPKHLPGEPVEAEFQRYSGKPWSMDSPGFLSFRNQMLAKLDSEEKVKQVREIINSTATDKDNLERLLSLREKEAVLGDRLNKNLVGFLQGHTVTLSQIQFNRYNTEADCCPKKLPDPSSVR